MCPPLQKYTVLEEIASGQFGKVHLALREGKIYAIKCTSIVSPNECMIHSALAHKNIIRLYEYFKSTASNSNSGESPMYYLVMEYGAGGELFDKIQPDIGVDEELAHFYFRQLISGVEYLHAQGVAHRDLKPENLLLDELGNLKICDFGLSTVFRHKGQRRRLTTVCGTRPYVAPEILFGEYEGEAVDIWACGMILFVLLLGNTAWDEPTDCSPEFCMYVMEPERLLQTSPWNRLRESVYELIRGMCDVYADKRFTMSDVKRNKWFRQQTSLMSTCDDISSSFALDRLLSQMNLDESDVFASQMDLYSQKPPAQHQPCNNSGANMNTSISDTSADDGMPAFAFSQPVEYIGTHGYNMQVNFSQPDKTRTAQLSITRFYTRHAGILENIAKVLTDFLVTFNLGQDSIHFSTVDKRKCPLNGEIRVQNAVQNTWLVHFRRINGDPLEFRRFYSAIKDVLSDFVCQTQQNN